MNFTEDIDAQEIQLELKYCERCGGLWLRLRGAAGNHCATCRVRLQAMPDPGAAPPRRRRRRKTSRSPRDLPTTRIDCLRAVATLEVRS